MDNVSIKIKGFNKLSRQLVRLGIDADKKLSAALYEEAEEILTDSKENYVPVDLGTLRGSGFVEMSDTDIIIIGFGGPAAPYAVHVHEDLNARHTVGSAKYLEIPLRKALPGMPDRLLFRMKR